MDKFEWYGTEWSRLHDLYNKMSLVDIVSLGQTAGIELIPQEEIVYLTGQKRVFFLRLAWSIGVNRLLAKDFEKYWPVVQKWAEKYHKEDHITNIKGNNSFQHYG